MATIVAPLYLDFVQVLACAYRPSEGFDWVKHDPIVERSRAPRAGDVLGDAVLEATPLRAAVDDLAITVVAHTRAGRPLPEALSVFADLFGPGGGEVATHATIASRTLDDRDPDSVRELERRTRTATAAPLP